MTRARRVRAIRTEQAAAWDTVRRGLVLAGGSVLVALGLALLVLPGPGILTTIAGLALLATEFVWARVWLIRIKKETRRIANTAKAIRARSGV